MKFSDSITTYTELFYRIVRLWNTALNHDSPEALSEINHRMDHAYNKTVIERSTGKFYRARIVSPNDYDKIHLNSRGSRVKGFCSDEMGPPPSEYVEDGRANRAKVSFLYLSSDCATACSEVKPVCGDLISVAPFELIQTVQIADLRNVPGVLRCITNHENPEELVDRMFGTILMKFFSIPVEKKRTGELYKYSQYASEYLQKKGVSGLMYNSSHNSNPGSYNLVLFDSSIAKCMVEYAEIINCLSVAACFQNVSKNIFETDRAEIIVAKKEIPADDWASTALLQQDLLNLKKKMLDY